jgi:hypothetical protein
MIKLKNGVTVEYSSDFDDFFRNILDAMIRESRKAVDENAAPSDSLDSLNESFLKELMDNCIYVTHQIFMLASECEDLSKFMVSGFIFNSILLMMQTKKMSDSTADPDSKNDDGSTIH